MCLHFLEKKKDIFLLKRVCLADYVYKRELVTVVKIEIESYA